MSEDITMSPYCDIYNMDFLYSDLFHAKVLEASTFDIAPLSMVQKILLQLNLACYNFKN
jgi:hypothetical protein